MLNNQRLWLDVIPSTMFCVLFSPFSLKSISLRQYTHINSDDDKHVVRIKNYTRNSLCCEVYIKYLSFKVHVKLSSRLLSVVEFLVDYSRCSSIKQSFRLQDFGLSHQIRAFCSRLFCMCSRLCACNFHIFARFFFGNLHRRVGVCCAHSVR